jgi:probable F420-dependent oxidoreductase
MRLGIITPIVSRNPRFDHPDWEMEAGVDEIARIVKAADQLGYDFCTFPEHIAVPLEAARARGGTYWSPLPVMGFLAGVTSRIRLATYVIVLGYHHPLAVVKEYGTLDRICAGRLILGVGVGSLREEFDLLGAGFGGRGARADDALRAIRACFGRLEPAYHGSVFDIQGFLVEPCGVQAHLPIWVGGRTRRSLRRALELGDGWAPFRVAAADAAAMLRDASLPRPASFEVVLRPEPPLDPGRDPGRVRQELDFHKKAGATALALRFEHRSLDHYLDQLAAMQEIAATSDGAG